MGASEFFQSGRGKTAEEAFRDAVNQARYDYGHAGYTGSLAEKDSFVEIAVPAGEDDPIKFADRLLANGDERVIDKWGPAGCVKVSEEQYYFFGWASS